MTKVQQFIKEEQGKHFCACTKCVKKGHCKETEIKILPHHHEPKRGIPRYIYSHRPLGEDSYNWKGGVTLQKYYCKDCGKQITMESGLYGKKRCSLCANQNPERRKKLSIASLGRKHTEKTKRKLSRLLKGCKKSKKTIKKQAYANFKGDKCLLCEKKRFIPKGKYLAQKAKFVNGWGMVLCEKHFLGYRRFIYLCSQIGLRMKDFTKSERINQIKYWSASTELRNKQREELKRERR